MSEVSASQAAQRLGVSRKALRLYEERGLVTPRRTAAGWRVYGAEELARAAEVVALRGLGLSLAEIARVMAGDAAAMAPALELHQRGLEAQRRRLDETIAKVSEVRARIADGELVARDAMAEMTERQTLVLPWPWGGELFSVERRPLTYITGPLASGKTRLAMQIAEVLAGKFLAMEQRADAQTMNPRAERALARLLEDGATDSAALRTLVCGLEGDEPLIIDMVEHGLDRATQETLGGYLRQCGRRSSLFVTTRSSSIVEPAALTSDEAMIYCPANHAPPVYVAGAPGYEAVTSCLASPEVRARTAGVIAYVVTG